jgi:hypothetical protein
MKLFSFFFEGYKVGGEGGVLVLVFEAFWLDIGTNSETRGASFLQSRYGIVRSTFEIIMIMVTSRT